MLSVTRTRREAVPAVDRLITAGLKRNFRYAAALAARCSEHLALAAIAPTASRSATAAGGSLTRRAAVAAPTGFVRKSFARKELLLVRSKGETASAIDAVKVFICVHVSLLAQ